ncbi:RNA-binding protein [Streptomyces sp. JV178]|uniref:ASCH domain-containing protein n=1 Tax=Streptomyces sp. JV178 TaxID=858632 RepID=UPI000C1B15DD|nr:ASCH domain-containing protein [Streptomyces sp. JV178]PIM73994.1 RNA-binding protein [Streptomyces sp. JV178]
MSAGGFVEEEGGSATRPEHRAAAEFGSLPTAEFAFPGPLRDRLVAAILDGAKTSTTGLVVDYEHEGEALPAVGDRSVVVDSDERPVAVIEVTGVRVVPLADVDLAHVVDEGEGHTSVAEWREGHERFWHSEEMRAALGDPGFTVDDTTPAVLERFRLIADLRPDRLRPDPPRTDHLRPAEPRHT